MELRNKNSDSIDLRTQVNLSEEDLSEHAKKQFIHHGDVLSVCEMAARNVLSNNQLSPIGRHQFCVTFEQNYRRYKNVLNYVSDHSESMKNNRFRPPLIICGLPRTGTTLLYNLLACDPTCRAILNAEILEPIPPLARSDTGGQMERNNALRAYDDAYNKLGLADNIKQESRASHPSFAYEEDQRILAQAGLNTLYFFLVPNTDNEFVKWFLNDGDKDVFYEYHRTFIKMLNSVDAPQSHWLLKGPLHSIYLDTLLRYYPSASLIITHRRLEETIPSNCRNTIAFTKAFFNHNSTDAAENQNTLVELRLLLMDTYARRLVEFRRNKRDNLVVDVFYDDLIAEPIETIRRIYQYFNLEWSEDFERAMLTWLHDNPQGKQGRNTYTLDEFGLTREGLEKRYEEYTTFFLKSHIPSKTDSFSPKNN